MEFNHYYDTAGQEILAGDTIERWSPSKPGGVRAKVFLDKDGSFRLRYEDSKLTPLFSWLSPRLKWRIVEQG